MVREAFHLVCASEEDDGTCGREAVIALRVAHAGDASRGSIRIHWPQPVGTLFEHEKPCRSVSEIVSAFMRRCETGWADGEARYGRVCAVGGY